MQCQPKKLPYLVRYIVNDICNIKNTIHYDNNKNIAALKYFLNVKK